MSEFDRQQEDERHHLEKLHEMFSPIIGIVFTAIGGVLFVSGIFQGGTTNPSFYMGVGIAALVGGGGYWLYAAGVQKDTERQLRAIRARFDQQRRRDESE